MPIHDWTRACDAAFHDFQLSWACELATRLNDGILPGPLYAMTETVELRPPTELLEMPEPDGPLSRQVWDEVIPDATDQPPNTAFRVCDDRRQYACRVVTVRDDLHQPLAVVVWLSRQDKETRTDEMPLSG